MRVATFAVLTILAMVTPRFVIAEEPTTKPADAATPTLIKPDDADAIKANIDKDVVIEGVIDKADWSGSGKVMKATFKDAGDSKLQVVVFVKDRQKFDEAFSGDVTKAMSGAKVRVKGKLKEYRNAPEIVMDQVNQLTLVDAAPTTQETK